MDMFKAALAEYGDKAGWGGFRCNAVDNRQNTISKRAKIVFVQWMPEGGRCCSRLELIPPTALTLTRPPSRPRCSPRDA